MYLLDAVVAAVDVVILGGEHVDHSVVLEVLDGPGIQIVHLLHKSIKHGSPSDTTASTATTTGTGAQRCGLEVKLVIGRRGRREQLPIIDCAGLPC
jgi:hypothetical protein